MTEVPFDDGTHGFSCDGTPVDCVRLASLGLVDDFEPELVVAGINHGSNLGDDITYSGTVAAALEGVVLGLPAVADMFASGAITASRTSSSAASARRRDCSPAAWMPSSLVRSTRSIG